MVVRAGDGSNIKKVRRLRHQFTSWAIASLLFAVPVLAQTAPPAQSNLVHFGDLIEVDVIGSFEFDWRGSLTPEGFLDGLDTVEDQVYALCRTEEELSAVIQKGLAKTLRDPKVAVRILDRSNRAVAFLTGAVRTPTRFQIKRPIYLNELLIMSGGITDRSSGEISIFRPANVSCTDPKKSTESEFLKASQPGGAETLSVRISDLLRGDPNSNPRILSGDIVTVSEAFPVYVIGGVTSPQQIPLRNQLTLSRAISMAGGLAKEGNTNIKIFRREGRETKSVEIDLQKVTGGQAEDPILKPFDIIDVPEKGKPARIRPPVIEGNSRVGFTTLPLRVVD